MFFFLFKKYLHCVTKVLQCFYTIEGGDRVEKPKYIFHKRADNFRNRVIIPKTFIDKHGKNFYMEVYENKIILKPVERSEND